MKTHDPGPGRRERPLDGVAPDIAASPLRIGDSGTIRIGTASWTDPTMTASGVFYPEGADSAEERLNYYASRFPVVEVDATYYALPCGAPPSCGSSARRRTSCSTSRPTR